MDRVLWKGEQARRKKNKEIGMEPGRNLSLSSFSLLAVASFSFFVSVFGLSSCVACVACVACVFAQDF